MHWSFAPASEIADDADAEAHPGIHLARREVTLGARPNGRNPHLVGRGICDAVMQIAPDSRIVGAQRRWGDGVRPLDGIASLIDVPKDCALASDQPCSSSPCSSTDIPRRRDRRGSRCCRRFDSPAAGTRSGMCRMDARRTSSRRRLINSSRFSWVFATKLRLTDDFDVECAAASGSSPTGSRVR